MPRHFKSAHVSLRTRSRRRHAYRGSEVSEFEQRAAAAWIRAADAGVIDARELAWLLDKQHELRSRTEVQTVIEDLRPEQ